MSLWLRILRGHFGAFGVVTAARMNQRIAGARFKRRSSACAFGVFGAFGALICPARANTSSSLDKPSLPSGLDSLEIVPTSAVHADTAQKPGLGLWQAVTGTSCVEVASPSGCEFTMATGMR